MSGASEERAQAWTSTDQRRLVDGLRAGLPPRRLCAELGRDAADVRHQVATLLGDPLSRTPSDPLADLDVLWLRVRTGSMRPTPIVPVDVVVAWQDATRIRLTAAQRADLAAEEALTRLLPLGRHDLRARARAVVARTGMLDLDDWADCPPAPATLGLVPPASVPAAVPAVPTSPAAPQPPVPTTSTAPTALSAPTAATAPGPQHLAPARRLLEATVEDVTPDLPRDVLRAHLGLTRQGPSLPVDAERRERARAVLEALRAASSPDRPAAHLRDLLVVDSTYRALVRELGVGIPAATTLAILGGRHEADALRVAGEALTRWHRPPNLGRGVVVRIRS